MFFAVDVNAVNYFVNADIIAIYSVSIVPLQRYWQFSIQNTDANNIKVYYIKLNFRELKTLS